MARRNPCTLYRVLLFLCLVMTVFWLSKLYSYASHLHIQKVKPKLHLEDDLIIKLIKDENFDNFVPVHGEGLTSTHCEIPYLKYRVQETSDTSATCKRLRPQAGSCEVAKKLFPTSPSLDCDASELIKICRIKGVTGSYTVECQPDVCAFPLFMATLGNSSGELDWQTMKSTSQLQESLTNMMNGNSDYQNYGFCFIKCVKNESLESILPIARDQLSSSGELTVDILSYEYLYAEYFFKQLLVLPPMIKKPSGEATHKEHININLVSIDSVSRHHFFRSLPKTVEIFDNINKYHETDKQSAVVLDFHLSQSIKTRTYESLRALLAGYANPSESSFGTLEMPPVPLKTEVLFGHFKNHGYKTLWLEDLCFLWEWGLSKDLLVHDKILTASETLTNLREALEKAAIDELGVTYASCEILFRNEANDPFHGLDKICYGGRHQHEYILEYLQYYQSESHLKKEPFVTFYMSNVGHDDSGRRIQTFDTHFMQYLEFVLTQENTVTVIFSDHGNTYGAFVDESYESRVEMVHPHMFILLPHKVQELLGSTRMSSLISNQDKLVSLLDLHFTLKILADINVTLKPDDTFKQANEMFAVKENGLFSPVSPSRSCDKMPSMKSSICICEGFDNQVKNDSYHAILALFAFGQLNNKIHQQFKSQNPSSMFGFGYCQRLVPSHFQNVKIRYEKDFSFIVKMEIHVKLDKSSKSEIFSVAVRVQPSTDLNTMELLSYERITAYNKFSECADQKVDLPLCICSERHPPVINLITHHVHVSLQTEMEIDDVDNTRFCVYVIVQKSNKGVTIDITNICQHEKFILDLVFFRRNMIVSDVRKKIRNVLKPGDVKFVLAAVQKDVTKNFDWQYLAEVYEIPQTKL